MHNNYNHSASYCRSKLANILFAKMLQHKLDEAKLKISAFSLHPGVVLTDLSLNARGIAAKIMMYMIKPFLYPILKTPA